eukprot:TRINITY_DN4150_c0_g2_i1.p2 TRINITY_DN4150_c0_g2~~TRINITY_DN4150_c0_g2_i1.p2  ORF type:complete len:130 (-),score=6.41 TRINITY_DN4150_c0_g2_i1:372-761(-)
MRQYLQLVVVFALCMVHVAQKEPRKKFSSKERRSIVAAYHNTSRYTDAYGSAEARTVKVDPKRSGKRMNTQKARMYTSRHNGFAEASSSGVAGGGAFVDLEIEETVKSASFFKNAKTSESTDYIKSGKV